MAGVATVQFDFLGRVGAGGAADRFAPAGEFFRRACVGGEDLGVPAGRRACGSRSSSAAGRRVGADVEADAGVGPGLGAGEGFGFVVLGFSRRAGRVAVDREPDLALSSCAVSLGVVVGRRGDRDRLALALAGTAATADRAAVARSAAPPPAPRRRPADEDDRRPSCPPRARRRACAWPAAPRRGCWSPRRWSSPARAASTSSAV